MLKGSSRAEKAASSRVCIQAGRRVAMLFTCSLPLKATAYLRFEQRVVTTQDPSFPAYALRTYVPSQKTCGSFAVPFCAQFCLIFFRPFRPFFLSSFSVCFFQAYTLVFFNVHVLLVQFDFGSTM